MRRVALLGAVLAIVCAVSGAAPVAAKRTTYPVTITIKQRNAATAGCPECQAFYGVVRSAKPVCARGRKVLGTVTYPKDSSFPGQTHEDEFGMTDRRGRWERVFIPIEPLARATAAVERMRLSSGAVCEAARASLKYQR
jgi:hypothetical protein